MSKSSRVKPPVTKRTGTPRIMKGEDGSVALICPFCEIPHALKPNAVSVCGTALILTAEQIVYHAKFDRKLVCVKCGKGGGDMVMRQSALVHVVDCMPGVAFLTEPPKFSKTATFVSKIKYERVRKLIERYTGRATPVDEVKEDGTRTGNVLGHFFHKENANAKRNETQP